MDQQVLSMAVDSLAVGSIPLVLRDGLQHSPAPGECLLWQSSGLLLLVLLLLAVVSARRHGEAVRAPLRPGTGLRGVRGAGAPRALTLTQLCILRT